MAKLTNSLTYTPNAAHCLVLTVEFDAPEAVLCSITAESLRKAGEVVTKTVGAVEEGDLAVELVKLPEADFNAVNSMEVSPTWWRVPMVIQCVASSGCLFLKVASCLTKYDGVAALHSILNIAEYLEHTASGKEPDLTAPAFKVANRKVDFDEKKMAAHQSHLESLRSAHDCSLEEVLQKGLPPGPTRSAFEEDLPARVWCRTSSQTSFKDFLGIMSQIKNRLKLSHVASTVNYSPGVGVSRLEDTMDVLDREKRVEGIFTPIGPPPPMNANHAELLSYMFFVNNYGKHNPNLSLLQVTGAVWNWTGLMKCFTPVVWGTTIQGKAFYLTSFAEPDHRQCEDLLQQINGEAIPLMECAQPSAAGTVAGG